MQILIVDDDPAIQRLYNEQLCSFGYDVTLCANAETALQSYQQKFHPLIVIDLGLPGMDGLELCRHIRGLPQGELSIILVITGSDEAGDLQAALDAGADDFLTKPVGLDLLRIRLRIIEQHLQNRTRRKRAEDNIRKQHTFLEHVLESLTHPFYVVDPKNYTVTLANSEARQSGISQRSTCHALLHNTTSPCAGHEQPCPIRIVKNTKKPTTVEHRHCDPRGNPKHVEIHAYPIFDEKGDVAQIIEYAVDITERKRAEEELRQYREHLETLVEKRTLELTRTNEQLQQEIIERQRAEQTVRASEQQYRALAEHVADGIVILQEGKSVFVNETLCTMLGHTVDQLLQFDPVALFRDEYQESFIKWCEQLMQGVSVPSLQAICLTGDGREIWTEERSSLIEWEGKAAILVAIRNITERKLRELEVEKKREHLQKENIALRSTIKDRYKFGELVGKSPAMQEVYEVIAHASSTEANVVISGESGTGKELIARTIHQLSDRRQQAFVSVNCGAIPETLFESEFFGHRKGAFTGADRDKEGLFDRAHHGTLFMDEVAELNPMLQVKLLRALELGEYMPLGSNSMKRVDVRIVTATNRDLEEQLQQKLMREDFFYRISVVTITAPPLRDRKEDIPLLIDHFLEHYSKSGKRPVLPGPVTEALSQYDWPGNIRQLQNALQRYLTVKRLDLVGIRSAESREEGEGSGLEFVQEGLGLGEALEHFEKLFITRALDKNHWHRGHTAKMLGIPERTLRRKTKKYYLS